MIARKVILVCLGLAALVFAVFGQTTRFDFVDYDDQDYVYQNPHVVAGLTPAGAAWALIHKEGGLWTPLVTLSHMADTRLFGLNAGWHHFTNLLLHLASVILLFLILLGLTGALWRPAFVAALFAIHPLHVESVAWISERKDVLSGFFFMLTLAAYCKHARRRRRGWWYWLAILFFACGLLAKPMLVSLPFVLLLLDYWPLNRLFQQDADTPLNWPVVPDWPVILEKIPFLAIAAAMAAYTYFGPRQATNIAPVPFWTRLGEAPGAVLIYLGQLFWPARLAVYYPHTEAIFRWWPATAAAFALITLAAFLLRRACPWLWMGWLWNLVMLLPVSGIVQISRHLRADHYNYLPQIGLTIALAWALATLAGNSGRRLVFTVAGSAVFVALLAIAAWRQTSTWRNSTTLWNHALSVTRDNNLAQTNLGSLLVQENRVNEAIPHYLASLQIDPRSPETHNDYGSALARKNRLDDAIAEYRKAVQLDPDLLVAHYNLGAALIQKGEYDEAIPELQGTIRADPGMFEAHHSLGSALLAKGRIDEAIAQFQAALQINPRYSDAHYLLGNAFIRQGREKEAVAQWRDTVRINPANALARNNLGGALLEEGQVPEAVTQLTEAVHVDPGNPAAQVNLGKALQREGKPVEAITHFQAAAGAAPKNPQVHYDLCIALLQQGRIAGAIAEARKALDLQPANIRFQNNLAWLLATASPTTLRDGASAVELAQKASHSTHDADPQILDTLAAAYAQAGDFPRAIQTASTALQIAQTRGDASLAAALQRELNLYKTHHSYQDWSP